MHRKNDECYRLAEEQLTYYMYKCQSKISKKIIVEEHSPE